MAVFTIAVRHRFPCVKLHTVPPSMEKHPHKKPFIPPSDWVPVLAEPDLTPPPRIGSALGMRQKSFRGTTLYVSGLGVTSTLTSFGQAGSPGALARAVLKASGALPPPPKMASGLGKTTTARGFIYGFWTGCKKLWAGISKTYLWARAAGQSKCQPGSEVEH